LRLSNAVPAGGLVGLISHLTGVVALVLPGGASVVVVAGQALV
jgi:hypothetical protein